MKQFQRIALLSDIHGNLPALEAVLADLAARRVDCVANLGDHLSGPLWPRETLVVLRAQNWTQIAGNHDRQLVTLPPQEHNPSDQFAYSQLDEAGLDWLRGLPATCTLDDDQLLFHGAPARDTTYLLETVERGAVRRATPAEISARLGGANARVFICGHTHLPAAVELPDGRVILNPGSVGLPAYEDTTPEYHVVETGSPHARYAILERRTDGWAVEFIALPYDHQRAADRARENQRPDWECALRTGWMRG